MAQFRSTAVEGRRIHVEVCSRAARVRGKFFFRGEEKLFLRGVCYGPFAPGSDGSPFPEGDAVRRDLALMAEMGANVVRTFTPPPTWLLDIAGELGLAALVGLPWAEHVCFLDDPEIARQARSQVRAGAQRCAAHDATLAILVGNEIPPDIVRWLGPERVARFLAELCQEVKAEAPDTLVSYANFPSTEYLDLDFIDFVSFNVYLESEPDFRRYLLRLQNVAGDRPLVLTEFGRDSMRGGEAEQGRSVGWQVRAAVEAGVAGTVVFSWTDEWFAGGMPVEDWAFGLVDRSRRRKPAYEAVQHFYRSALPPAVQDAPKVSVVVCAYNAERTLEACLDSMRGLRYPNFEVLVVNDGSTDATRDIVCRFAEVTLIEQPNLGLSAARNAGARAACGEIVAYTDADCVVDPDWLTYLVYKIRDGFVAVGGPNLPPPEDARIPACVAVAPGGPTHVLLGDDVAEHIPGCNMAFLKSALERIHGFDTTFRAAGDDVDLCWRLQDIGYSIGFSAAAMVWHFRRNTVRAYLEQQMGYGNAEALLFFKHPYRFNLLGHSKWFGRIYGDSTISLFSPRPVIYHGTFGRGLFQTLYETPASPLTHLPFTLEWTVVGLVLLVAALAGGGPVGIALVPLSISVASSLASAWRVKVDPRFDDAASRLLIALLIFLGPLVRSGQRYLRRMQGLSEVERIEIPATAPLHGLDWLRWQFEVAFWSDHGLEKESVIHAVLGFLIPRRYLTTIDQGWSDWDFAVTRGAFGRATLQVAAENHGGAKRLLRVRCRLRSTRLSRVAMIALVGVAGGAALAGVPEVGVSAGAIAAITAVMVAYQNLRLARVLRHVLEASARGLGLRSLAERSE